MSDEVDAFAEDSGISDSRREQSTISFPYSDLDTAIEVARAIYNRSGLGSCELDELAAEMNQTISGAFRLKIGTARVFDLIERDGRGSNKLSELGRQIISPDTEKSARAEAFLRVPLYAAIFEKYKGHLLPPAKALEREMLGLGVSSKQTDKARQAFDRSARQSGFFELGDDRLVRPKIGPPIAREVDAPVTPSTVAEERARSIADQPKEAKSYHPFIEGLLKTLPEPDADWSVSDRTKWLQTAASIFGLIYKGEGAIRVTVDEKQ